MEIKGTRILLIICFLGMASFLVVNKNSLAQEAIPWSEPENLSNTPTKSHQPFIVTDKHGYVHVFWVEDVGGPDVSPEEQGRSGNTIFYRRWDGEKWSFPIDIFFSRGLTFSYPSAAVDDNNILYLTWMAFNGLHFSSVPAHLAGSALNWSDNIVLTPVQGASRPAILARGQGEIDIIYDSTFNLQDFAKNGNLYHIKSTDGGLTWSTPVQITEMEEQGADVAVFPRLAIDASGRLHAVWYTTNPPDLNASAVYYSRSIDNGETWSTPLKIDEETLVDEKNWADDPLIGIIGENEVILTWVCGVLPGRCYVHSTDGGETWSPMRTVFGDLHSKANWDAMATDAGGHLYWIMQLRYPEALYYSYWTGEGWIDPPMVVHSRDPAVSRGHGLQLAISKGNELHLVIFHPEIFEVWHIWGVTSMTSPTTPVPTPTAQPYPTPTAISSLPDGSSALINLTAQPSNAVETPASAPRPDFSMMMGVIAAIILIGVVAVIQLSGRKI